MLARVKSILHSDSGQAYISGYGFMEPGVKQEHSAFW
jgi:hypothetical protein